jgi:hypothetical protein
VGNDLVIETRADSLVMRALGPSQSAYCYVKFTKGTHASLS